MTSSSGNPERPETENTSLVQVRIGGRVYDARYSRSCACCVHPARMAIEERLVTGVPYQEIAREYSEVEYRVAGQTKVLPKINWTSIRNHYHSGHMPVNAAAVVQLAEERAKELGKNYEELTQRVVDQYLVARTVLTKGQQGLANGTLHPDVKDTLAAAKLLHEFEQANKVSVDAEAWTEAFEIYFSTAQRLMPPDLWEKFARQLSINPILKALTAKMSRQAEQEALEGEVVDAEPPHRAETENP